MSDIRTLSIDIETYSGYDLNKCGVYKYVEHPDFVDEQRSHAGKAGRAIEQEAPISKSLIYVVGRVT